MMTKSLLLLCSLSLAVVHGTSPPSPQLPTRYSAEALFTIFPVDDSETASSSMMVAFNRDSELNKTIFKYNLDDFRDDYVFHVDVVQQEEGELYGYFWYEDSKGNANECIRSKWSGSSNRSPWMALSLEEGAIYSGQELLRGQMTHCWSSAVPGYGPVKQCYIGQGPSSVPWVSEAVGECCPGSNRWDFGNFYSKPTFEDSVFDIPADCR